MMRIARRAVIKALSVASAAAAGLARIDLPAHAQAPPPPAPPWERRRGLWMIDYNNSLIFIRLPIDDVAGGLADGAERWDRDVLGREIVLGRRSAFVFRLRGHSWTIVLPELLTTSVHLDARDMSARLKARVVDYGVSDTSASIGYSLYENGELLERFGAIEGSAGRPGDDSVFTSRLSSLKLEQIDNIWDFVHQFLVAQDVLEPGISFGYFLSPTPPLPPSGGETARIVNSGFRTIMPDGNRSPADVPPIERIDYWVPMPRRP